MWVTSLPSWSQPQRNSIIKRSLFYQVHTHLEHNIDKCTPEKYCSLKYVRVLKMLKGKEKAHNFMMIILWPRAPHVPELYLIAKTTWTYFCPACGTSLSSWPLPSLSVSMTACLPSSALTWTVRTPPLPIPPWPSQSPASILIFPILLLPEGAPVLALRAYKFVFPPRRHCPTFLKVWSHCKENTGQWTRVLSSETHKYKRVEILLPWRQKCTRSGHRNLGEEWKFRKETWQGFKKSRSLCTLGWKDRKGKKKEKKKKSRRKQSV